MLSYFSLYCYGMTGFIGKYYRDYKSIFAFVNTMSASRNRTSSNFGIKSNKSSQKYSDSFTVNAMLNLLPVLCQSVAFGSGFQRSLFEVLGLSRVRMLQIVDLHLTYLFIVLVTFILYCINMYVFVC